MIREYHCFGERASDPSMQLLATVFGFRWWQEGVPMATWSGVEREGGP